MLRRLKARLRRHKAPKKYGIPRYGHERTRIARQVRYGRRRWGRSPRRHDSGVVDAVSDGFFYSWLSTRSFGKPSWLHWPSFGRSSSRGERLSGGGSSSGGGSLLGDFFSLFD
ncbi:MAG TPA: hypothetical protein VF597_04560 [Candidatus Saccharimonadales bacterium]|jgi:hypothetical protein